jgi:hypothetical protein
MDPNNNEVTTRLRIRRVIPHGKTIVARLERSKVDRHRLEGSVKKETHLRDWEDLEAELCEYGQLSPIEAEHLVQPIRSTENYERDDSWTSVTTKHGTTHRPRESEAPIECSGSGQRLDGPYRSMNNSNDSTNSTTSTSISARVLSSEGSGSSEALIRQPLLSPRSKAMCESLQAWPYSANDSKSVDIRVDVMNAAEYQTETFFSSDYSDSWSGFELDHEEESLVECRGAHEKFSIDMYDGDGNSESNLQTFQAGRVVWEDNNSIFLDTMARSRRSRCPSRDLSEATSTSNPETATTPAAIDYYHDNSSADTSTTTSGMSKPTDIIAASARVLLRPKNCISSTLSPTDESARDPAVEIQATSAAPQHRKRQSDNASARSNISISNNSRERIQSGPPIALPRRRLRRGAKRQRVLSHY